MKTKQTFLVFFALVSGLLLSAQTPQWQWVRGGGSQDNCTNSGLFENCKWMGTDDRGNIYGMSSVFNYGIEIDTSVVPNGFGYDDFAVFSYRCDGSFRWVRYFGNNANDIPSGMITDNDGNSFIAGWVVSDQYAPAGHYGDTIIEPGTTLTPAAMVAKLDSNGHTCWISFGAMSTITGYDFISVKPDNQGNICILTKFSGAITWGSFNIPEKGYYVVKFDKNNGNVIGVTKLNFNGNPNYCPSLIGFHIDTDNSYYLKDFLIYPDTIFIGDSILTSEVDGVFTSVITKFSPNGNLSWFNYIKGTSSGDNIGMSLIAIGDDYVYADGAGQNGTNFFGNVINNNNPNILTPFVARFRKDNGSFVSFNHLNNSVYTAINVLATTSNSVLLAGLTGGCTLYNTNDTIKPFPTELNTGYPFVMEIDTALTHFNWGIATRSNTPNDALVYVMVVNNAGDIYAGGTFSDSLYDGFGHGISNKGGSSEFFVAKISTNNDCNCTTANPFPQLVGISGKTLTVTGTATGLWDSLYWNWGDGTSTKYLTQNTNASHLYTVGGDYSVCLRSYNSCGTKDACLQVAGVGIDEPELKYLNAYPNPVSNTLTIENPYQCAMQLSIYQLTGKLLFSKQYQNYSNTLDMSAYEAGIYFVEIKLADGRKAVRKVVKN
jgi:hypothetical protein